MKKRGEIDWGVLLLMIIVICLFAPLIVSAFKSGDPEGVIEGRLLNCDLIQDGDDKSLKCTGMANGRQTAKISLLDQSGQVVEVKEIKIQKETNFVLELDPNITGWSYTW